LIEKFGDDDPVARGNALFCFRMSREAGDEVRYDPGKVLPMAVMLLQGHDPTVCEEAVRLIQSILENELVPVESVSAAVHRIEELSGTGSLETTKAAEAVLYMLKETGLQ
ncbi:MAG: hypothetical protein JW939_01110, partial [Candidatus Thermoplasmatota archaeon]|nr:hypothetical protein [Candidatus Thermoplasmatota archaeon]